ncbi:MAG: Gfo/Idh/MocA family protein [Thermoguttaceae bacterium]
MTKPSLSRRDFLSGTSVATAAVISGAAFAVPTFVPREVFAQGARPGANERITVGCVSAGGRARLLMEQLPETAQLVAVADANFPQVVEWKKVKNADWDLYNSHWPILARKDIDAVIIAGQEFQRVYPCIHACEAGKDVYAEKPLTLYIQEGRTLVNCARKHKTVFQVGTQQRSMEMNRVACEFVRNGGLGKLTRVQALCYTGVPATCGVDDAEHAIPSGLNWDLHLNQGAWHNYHPGWINGRNFYGGEMTNWGAHGIDQIQWALGKDDTLPVEFEPVTPGQDGKVIARYADGTEIRVELENGPHGGGVFTGEKGKLEINRNKFTSNPKEISEELLKKVDEAQEEVKWSDQTALWQAKWHMQNWLDCIKTRAKPVSDVEIGHRSIALCHLVNITRWMGRTLKFDPKTERFIGDDEANVWNDRPRRKGYELPNYS